MKDSPTLAVAIRAARAAAAIVVDAGRDLGRLPSHVEVRGDVVAATETEARSIIVATLRAAFPHDAILGEETEESASRAGSPRQWIVDPLDGARNFVRGLPYYAISIALLDGGRFTHAVIVDPVRDELFTGVRGYGAHLNGTPLRVSPRTRLADALVGTVFPKRSSAKMPAYLPLFNALITQCAGIRGAGACALDLAYVAAGRLDGFWATTLAGRDTAAGAVLVEEAGGRVGDFAGGSDYLRSHDVIAAAPGVFNALREAIVAARAP